GEAAAATASLTVHGDAGELAFSGAELLLAPPASLASFLARWWERGLERLPRWPELVACTWSARDGFVDESESADLAALFAHHESSRLLTPTRGFGGGTGVAALNEWFRAALLGVVKGPL